MHMQTARQALTTGYLLLLGILLFLWPVVAGIPSLPMRLAWVGIALVCVQGSGYILERALLRNGMLPPLRLEGFPWLTVFIVLAILAIPLFTVPLHAFSDEINIILPTLTLLAHTARLVSWPGLLLLSTAGVLLFTIATNLRPMAARILICLFAVVALVVALQIENASPLALRYPPLVHLVQGIATVLAQGDLTMLRSTNLLWTLLLILAIVQGTPGWPRWAQIGSIAALLLSPLGWTYHTALYQACGEITFGMTATLLLTNILHGNEASLRSLPSLPSLQSSLLGILFALWVLYRPTSIVALGAALVLLLALHRWRDAQVVAGIALPIAFLWLLLYPSYSYDFLLQGGKLFPAAEDSLLAPIVALIRSFPGGAHPAIAASLLLGSVLVARYGERRERWMLAAAWVIALPPTLAQQVVLPSELHGFMRYTILLLLPLATATGALLASRVRIGPIAPITGTVVLLSLVLTTPWRIGLSLQEARRDPARIYQSTAGADIPLPVLPAAEAVLRETRTPIILAPDVTFLDLFIAQGLLTPEERSAIITKSAAWTPASPLRPVLIQAPVVGSYQPNISAELEDRLRAARTWALKQPGHRVVRYGIEETVVVP